MKIFKNLFLIAILILSSRAIIAQEIKSNEKKINILFGLNQIFVTNGFNVEINYLLKDFILDYSHGFGLEFKNNLITDEAKNQKLNFNISHSIGFGFGYRFTKNFNLRLEPKIHIWEIYYVGNFKSTNQKIGQYNTYTLGLGAYYTWKPFEKQNNFLNGIVVAPSVRWWPNVASTLTNNELKYFNVKTGKDEIHKANNIGIMNSPFFGNISIGYSF